MKITKLFCNSKIVFNDAINTVSESNYILNSE